MPIIMHSGYEIEQSSHITLINQFHSIMAQKRK